MLELWHCVGFVLEECRTFGEVVSDKGPFSKVKATSR